MFCHLWIVCSDGLRCHSTGITRILVLWNASCFGNMESTIFVQMGDQMSCVCALDVLPLQNSVHGWHRWETYVTLNPVDGATILNVSRGLAHECNS